MTILLAAVFLTFSSVAFVSDLAEPRPSPYWWVLVYAANTGVVAVGYALISTRNIRFWALAIAANSMSIYGACENIAALCDQGSSRDTSCGAAPSSLAGRMVGSGSYMFFSGFASMEGRCLEALSSLLVG